MARPASKIPEVSEQRSDWILMPHTLGDPAGARVAVGLIALANDLTSEPELITFLPKDGVALYTNRIPMAKVATVETLREMERNITRTVEGLVPEDHLDVIAFGCTSGTMAIGPETVSARIHETKPGIHCTDPISAGLKGLKKQACTRIALLTPYIDQVNAVVEDYVSQRGFDIVVKGSFKQKGDPQMCRISPEAIYDAGLRLGREDVDGLFISCTALRVSPIIEKLEQALGKPVVSSNQALAWDCLRLAGYNDPVNGFGRLLTI
ncbi:MAG: Asp/Glu racemase [Gammaproteobacteria bacterium]|nr:Asp/Glu racemase [Gammaproteobacteria bacterium]